MDVNSVLRAADLGLFQNSNPTPPVAPQSLESATDSEEFLRIASAVNTQGASVLTATAKDNELLHVVWQGLDDLHLLKSDGSTFAIKTEARVTALASSEEAVLVGCANGELYRLDVESLTMHCMYAQVRREAITCIEFFDDSHACLFLCASGTVYVCRDMVGQGRVRRLKRSLGKNVRLLLLHKITKEFVWIEGNSIFSGDLLSSQRHIDDCAESIARGVFSNDGSLLYLLSDQHMLYVYSWVGDCRRLFQKQVDSRISDLFVSDSNAAYGVIAQDHTVMVKPLS